MSDMKCPICQQELKISGHELHDLDLYCDKCEPFMVGNEELWQALIDTKKKLDVAVDALKSAKTRLELINNSKFANLNNVLQIQCQCEVLKINEALEQITALEQKDK